MSANELSRLLGQLLGETPSVAYLPDDFRKKINDLLKRYQSQDKLQSFFMHYALRMTEITYERLYQPAPLPDERLLQQFLERLKPSPQASSEFFQSAVEPDSSLRRALSIHRHLKGRGRVLFMGDDDATSLALSLLADYQFEVIDIDPRIVSWLNSMGVAARVQDIRQLPSSYHTAFEAVVTDPPADFVLAEQFLLAANSCLPSTGWLFWADHPDWNQQALTLLERADSLGLKLLEQESNWHAYEAQVINDSTAKHFNIPPQWFYELIKYVKIWSHLYILRKL